MEKFLRKSFNFVKVSLIVDIENPESIKIIRIIKRYFIYTYIFNIITTQSTSQQKIVVITYTLDHLKICFLLKIQLAFISFNNLHIVNYIVDLFLFIWI